MNESVSQSSFQPTMNAVNRGDSLWVTLAHAVCDFISKIWNWLFPPPLDQSEVNNVRATTEKAERTSEYMRGVDAYIDRYIDLESRPIENRGMSPRYAMLLDLKSKNPPPFHTLKEFIQNSYLLENKEMKWKEKVTRSIYTVVFAKNHKQLDGHQSIKSAGEITTEEMDAIRIKYKPYISARSLASSELGDSFQDMGSVDLTVPKTAKEFAELQKGKIDGAFVEAYFRGGCWKYVKRDINKNLCLAYIEGYGKNQDQEVLDKWTRVLKGEAL